MLKLSILVYVVSFCVISVHAYRDGAREESCYDHSINHTTESSDAFVLPCVPDGAQPCRYFLIIKEVVNETTLELGNETNSYECGKVYGIEVANNLNAPEGFLVQARNGTNDSSEIIGTFLDPVEVGERTGMMESDINYKILQCKSSESSTGQLLDNSATQPDTVNMAGTLQLYWQSPNCTACNNENDPNITMWFTIVQQLLIVYSPSKSTVLTYKPPPPAPIPTSCIMAVPSTSSSMIMAPGSGPSTSSSPTPPSPVTDNGDVLSQEAIIGIGAGGGFLVIFLILVVFVIVVIAVKASGSKTKPSIM